MDSNNVIRLDRGQYLVYILDVRGNGLLLGFEEKDDILPPDEFQDWFTEQVKGGSVVKADYLILLAPTEQGVVPINMDNGFSAGFKFFNTKNIFMYSFEIKDEAKTKIRQFIDTEIRPGRTGVTVVRTNLSI